MQIPLWINKKTKEYYHVGNAVCERCNTEITDILCIWIYWDKKRSGLNKYCLNCINKPKKETGTAKQTLVCHIVKNPPTNTHPLLIRPPIITDSQQTPNVFAAADKQIEQETTNDNTRYAGRETWKDAQIGTEVNDAEKDKALTDTEADALLLDLKEATPIGIKRIGNR